MAKPLSGRRPSGSRQPSKRQAPVKLMVHGPEYGTGEELVVNPESFPDLKLRDIVEITQPDRSHLRLIMQVRSLAPVRGKLQISILKDLALQFQLEPFHEVTVQRIEPEEATVDFIELSFKDQFMSRADIWRYKVAMFGKCLFVGKVYETLGTRAQVEMLLAKHENVLCGVMGTDTKLILRSRSSRIFWIIQMSTEMWDFADDGEMYFEKLVQRLVRSLVAKWHEASVSHSVTVLVFSRSYYDRAQFPSDYDPTADVFADECNRQAFGPGATGAYAPGHGPAMHVDAHDRLYEDFYKVLIQDYTGPDWSLLLRLLKEEFATYAQRHRWRLPQDPHTARYTVSSDGVVWWHELPKGVPARASEGNVLEAINVTLNVLEKHYMDRDLNRAGQGIVMMTAGSAVFKVPKRLAQITKQRMMDTGVGMDMISLTTPPLHPVPLFIWSHPAQQADEYNVPHWISVSFLDFDCTCGAAKKSLLRCHCQSRGGGSGASSFSPLPVCRMLDRASVPRPLLKILSTTTPPPLDMAHLLPPLGLQRTIDHAQVASAWSKESMQEYDDGVFGDDPAFVPLKFVLKKLSFSDKDTAEGMRKRVISMQNLQRAKQTKPGMASSSLPLSPIPQSSHDPFSPTFSPPEDTPVHHHMVGSSTYDSLATSLESCNPSPLTTMMVKNRSMTDMGGSPRSQRHPSIELVGSPPSRFHAPFSNHDHAESKLTSNRRRWSHIFPWSSDEAAALVGPNWKSLVNPAVLPLTTDFYPKDLHQSYTESFYSLMLLETHERSTHQLLVEMVCQRLASDFQLVEMHATTQHTTDESVRPKRIAAAATHRMTYYLSMGHRIHKLIFDDAQQTVDVKCYHKRLKTTNHDPVVYEYSLYDPTTASFHKQLQTFHEFPFPEDNWNTTDNLLCGYVDSMHDGSKCRRIRFVVVPPKQEDDDATAAYLAKVQKLLDFIAARASPDEPLHVTTHAAPRALATCDGAAPPAAVTRQYVRVDCNTAARLEIDCRNEWLMLLVDADCYPNVNWHVDVRWLACSGTVVDDFVATLRRKSKQAGLELRRVPEFTQVHDLHIHPCLSSVLLPVPETDDLAAAVATVAPSWGFVLDGAHLADAIGIGHGLMRRRLGSNPGPRRPVGCPETWKARGYVQYMHRTSPVFLRVLHDGIVWIPNPRAAALRHDL
ncbi:Aste57867_20038 [Aphanomyces stellatus]|uniref:Aste57867_20038 protein n=1 Tax=Aphanomyces stellatus TaxID=120398 RepID=A0A485LE27_9STRA|nr:hypothetical protein As57867_019972 [Aphanomyces stellatus]VFT96734.1 Aste57867_20038 [Aphanomyces stellatus]